MNVLKSEELIKELIERVAGEVGVIIYEFKPKDEFTDEKLSLELGIDINDIRKALFALYEMGLAEYRRKRDDETGWMEYYWKINYDKQNEILRKELLKTKKKLEEKIKDESSTIYYICINGCMKVSYEQAIEYNFTCPRCGAQLEYIDPTLAIEKAKEEIKKIDEILDNLK
ncbi:MAG TPA: transcription factor E [Archaeoglobus profundus]|nr:transcription factor E [Archaeoglobus profundus]